MSFSFMPGFLVASADTAFIALIEPVLAKSFASVAIVSTAREIPAALDAPAPPELVLVDSALPGLADGQPIRDARANAKGHTIPIVLLADDLRTGWMDLLADGSLDDILPRDPGHPHWRLRLGRTLHSFHQLRQLERLREAAAQSAQIDPLTGLANRSTLLAQLFRETDRAQRMRTPLCLLLLDIDDFTYRNAQLGQEACDDLLCQVAARTLRMLRSYDSFGRLGNDEFLAILPACDAAQGTILAQRIRMEVFSHPFQCDGGPSRLSACFGVAASHGISPLVVLKDAEQAMRLAQESGPESIQSLGLSHDSMAGPIAFLPHISREL
jgi:diguanylate cyclase (GGDEF)-like protein